MVEVVMFFYDEWSDFRIPEYNSLLEMLDVPTKYQLDASAISPTQAFVIATLPDERIAAEICARAVLVKGIYELWGRGSTFEDMVQDVRIQATSNPRVSTWVGSTLPWSISVFSYHKSMSQSQKESLRCKFRFLDFRGLVVLDDPELFLGVLLDFSSDHVQGQMENNQDIQVESRLPAVPSYFGRLLATGGMRKELRKYDLKKRLYLGPTTLDHSLALIMANIAGAKKGSMALDPFVGTASILIALSHFGAICTGMDIDVRVLKGAMYAGSNRHGEEFSAQQSSTPGSGSSMSVQRDIFETFRSYDLELPELIRMDIHLLDRHFVSLLDGIFDVIVTDPPYGIRAGGRKTGKLNGCTYVVPNDSRQDHIPSTQNYPVEEVMLDLLHASAKLLKINGSLCYLIPTPFNFEIEDLPKHPCLTLIRYCHQGLSTRHGRHLVLMRKTCEYSQEAFSEFNIYRNGILSGKESIQAHVGFRNLLGKLELALAAGGFDNDAVVKHASKGAIRRKESAKKRHENTWSGPFNGRPPKPPN